MAKIDLYGYGAILVDCFDTLLLRRTDSNELLLLWAARVRSRFQLDITAEQLRLLRTQLTKTYARQHECDPDFRTLMRLLYDALIERSALLQASFAEFLQHSGQLEYELELAHIGLNHVLIEQLQGCDAPLYLVSDNCHGQEFIERLLFATGMPLRFAGVYVSVDYNKSKRNGLIYDQILADTGCRPAQLLMLGADYHADILMPRSRAIRGHLLSSRAGAAVSRPLLGKRQFITQLQRRLRRQPLAVFPEMTLTLHLFIEKLILQARRDGVDTLVFLSQEGQLLKLLTDRYISHHRLGGITTRYLFASVESSLLASLGPLSTQRFTVLARQVPRQSMQSFTALLGIDPGLGRAVAAELDFAFDQQFDNFFDSQEFARLRDNEQFQRAYNFVREEQRGLLQTYFNRVAGSGSGVALVGLGWHGVVQDQLQCVLGEQRCLKGYYFGFDAEGMCSTADKQALLFKRSADPTSGHRVYRMARKVLELYLAADHGRVCRYEADQGAVRPVLQHVERHMLLYRQHVEPGRRLLLQQFETALRGFSASCWSSLDVEPYLYRSFAQLVLLPRKRELKFVAQVAELASRNAKQKPIYESRLSTECLRQFAKNPRQHMLDHWWAAFRVHQLLGRVGLYIFALLIAPRYFRLP